jgi:hypothetical protein
MSIRDFYLKLISGNEENSFLGTLRRLSLVEDASHFSGGGTGNPSGDWGQWPSAIPSSSQDGGYCPAV